MKKYFRALSIAGSDSGGGAGIQADLKTFSALGVYGSSVITAITAQNTCDVTAIQVVEPSMVQRQIDAVLSDVGADAIKIGMLSNADTVSVVADRLSFYQTKNIVLDPVMISKSGNMLLQADAIQSMQQLLFPLISLLTPNIPEAETLTGHRIQNKTDMEKAAQILLSRGLSAVLIKGGHLQQEFCSDYLAFAEAAFWFEYPKVHTSNTHGTGCTLAAAIAGFLARGFSLVGAVQQAKCYLQKALSMGAQFQLGNGYGPVCHFYTSLGDVDTSI